MWDCVVLINVCRGLIGLAGALAIAAGAIKIDRDYDNHGTLATFSGSIPFFIGWLLFASSIGLLKNDLSGLIMSYKALLGVVSSSLAVATIVLSQAMLYQKNRAMMRLFFVLFIGALVALAYAISLPSSAITATDPLIKFSIALIGATGIVWGKFVQMLLRKRGLEFIMTGTPSPADSYSPGLPLYVVGWIFLAFANALL